MTFAIAFPSIDPVIFTIGPFAIRWYALAYVAGLLLAWWTIRRLARGGPSWVGERDVDDFLVWAVFGVVLGGRLGYVLFYRPGHYLANPLEALQVWHGGMSFHGGLLGVLIAGLIYTRRRDIPRLPFADLVSCVAPIGLFLGRIANFINGELYGRATDAPWAMVFPYDRDQLPRHPSQLYEAALEGGLLFIVLILLWRVEAVRRRPGVLTGVFIGGYGLSRFAVEFVREPDAHLGFLYAGATMGQMLSLPMVLIGLWLILRARPRMD